MKIKKYLLVVPTCLMLMGACNSSGGKDSEKVAEKSNEQKADSSGYSGEVDQ
ncbi:hypothetical protein [Mucilaginibacter sp. FT3.2]|uniref:hypothetical protein n=1 Tax=Mucilaginibacter sp. FT3.2 TaxID=2723090 RepID=UPI00160971A2|nr:hypothetical protein [Mucilaginibacter sp. FT3.2]MBB6235088.1 hypothetical protein [Mucilaginibacter sp. FT3.2]